uniref:Uncharacterized protein n=1 Tax=Anguilla anguilla TaxID=7936 RepID=A0A0E9WET9_ANGAN
MILTLKLTRPNATSPEKLEFPTDNYDFVGSFRSTQLVIFDIFDSS